MQKGKLTPLEDKFKEVVAAKRGKALKISKEFSKYYGSGNILAIQLEKINRLQERIFFNNPRITHVTTKNANFLHISKRDFAIVISCDDIDLGYQAFCGCSLLKTINLDAKKLTFQMNAFLIVSN